ncbi:hypothetical protein FRC03_010141 [Tulasnella sp. 419]|nr:hypothetical protein FRC03_010141 [Tulasnella sp. 419]
MPSSSQDVNNEARDLSFHVNALHQSGSGQQPQPTDTLFPSSSHSPMEGVESDKKGKGKQTSKDSSLLQPPGRKLCVRHQRMADEGTNLRLQKTLDELPITERETVNMIWSTFSSSSASRRALILQGILTMCCQSQLSLLSEMLKQINRVDPFSLFPREVSLKVLGFLDAQSLTRAAQVSHQWRSLADDDILWKAMCEQHIEKKCTKCGWGLPLLERRRTTPSSSDSPSPNKRSADDDDDSERPSKRARSDSPHPYSDVLSSQSFARPSTSSIFQNLTRLSRSSTPASDTSRSSRRRTTKPWKDVYSERLTIERNWRRGRSTVRVIQGHTDGIMCLQYNEKMCHPAFPVLITGSYDRTVRVWNMETGQEMRRLLGHTRAVRALQFDECKLVTGSMDRTLRLWNWRTGECIRTLEGHSGGVVCLHFDSNVLVSGSVDKTVKVWNFRTGDCFTLRGHLDWVNAVLLWDAPPGSLDFNAGGEVDTSMPTPSVDPGKMLFSASDDGSIRLWDLTSRVCVRKFEGHVGQVQSIQLAWMDGSECRRDELESIRQTSVELEDSSTDGSHTPSDQAHSLFNFPASTEQLMTPPPVDASSRRPGSPPLPFNSSAYLPNLNSNPDATASESSVSSSGPVPILISGSLDNTIKLWDINTGGHIKTLFGHIEGVWSISSDKLRLVSASHDKTIKVCVPKVLELLPPC